MHVNKINCKATVLKADLISDCNNSATIAGASSCNRGYFIQNCFIRSVWVICSEICDPENEINTRLLSASDSVAAYFATAYTCLHDPFVGCASEQW